MTFRYYHKHADEYDALFKTPLDIAEDRGMAAFAGVAPNVLDLGCGTGLYLDHNPFVRNYVSLDLAPEMLAIAKSKYQYTFDQPTTMFGQRTFVCADMTHPLEFDDQAFDLVVSLSFSMSHAFNHWRIPSEIARVLKDGGRAFLVYIGERGFDWPHLWDYLDVPVYDAYQRWTVAGLKAAYRPYFSHVTVFGFNCFANRLFRGGARSERFLYDYLMFEAMTIGVMFPSLGAFFSFVWRVHAETVFERICF